MSQASRLEGLDLARFLAFVGMVIVNFKVVMVTDADTGGLAGFTAALEGRAAATFVVLAGVGLELAGARGLDRTLHVTLKRALFLMVLGLLNMTIFDADILHYYAAYFLFGVLLLPLGSRALIGTVVALNLLFCVMVLTLNYEAGWDWTSYSYSGFWTPTGFLRNLFFNGWHPVIPWLGFLLFGVVLGRLPLSRRRVQAALAIGGACALGLAELLSALLTPVFTALDPELADLATTSPIPPMPLYTLAGIGAACGVIGVSLLVAPALQRLNLLQMITPAGRQTLTLYVAHIVLGMGTLEALGMLGGQSLAQSVTASVVFCVFATLYAWVWARWFKRGPIEALMRKTAG